jgi:hypothetical protein
MRKCTFGNSQRQKNPMRLPCLDKKFHDVTLSLVTSQNFTYGNSLHQKLPKSLPKVKLDEVNIELIPSLVTSLNITYDCSFHQKFLKSLL